MAIKQGSSSDGTSAGYNCSSNENPSKGQCQRNSFCKLSSVLVERVIAPESDGAVRPLIPPPARALVAFIVHTEQPVGGKTDCPGK
jgi:hypothetical protein